jgi:hypothetical protein
MAVLLIGTLLWGQCALCPLLLPAQETASHDCCKPKESGHCGAPDGRSESKRCPNQNLALETYQKAELQLGYLLAPPASAVPAAELLPERDAPAVPALNASVLLVHSPPELYLENSVLLI